MHEVITLQVGQCGNQIGNEFWKKISAEHKLDTENPLQTSLNDCKNTFFYESDSGRYIPRSILIDLEPRVINQIMPNYNPDNIFIAGEGGGAGNNWTHGYFFGNKLKNEVSDMIQREAESCDSLETFYLMHSVAGGTGSGFGSFLLQEIKDLFPKKILTSYSILPNNEEGSDVVVQPYNTLLTLNQLNLYCDSVILMDNYALSKVSMNEIGMRSTNYNIINSLVSTVISASNSSIRFPGHMFCNSTSILNCSVPIKDFKFLIPSYSPFTCEEYNKICRKTTVEDVMVKLLLPKTRLARFETSATNSTLSIFNVLEGVKDVKEVTRTCEMIMNKKSINFLKCMPPFFQNVISKKEPEKNRVSGLCLQNTTGVCNLIKKVQGQFDQLKRRNAFLEMYKKYDTDLSVFDTARENVQNLIENYEKCQSYAA